MKQLLLIFCLGFWSFAGQAQSTISTSQPPDTVAGHAQLLHVFSESLCSKLDAASKRLNFRQMPSAESDELIKKLTKEIVLENRQQFRAVGKQVVRKQRRLYFSLLGRDALLRMADTCPPATAFLTNLNYEGLTDKSPVSEAEKAVLLPITEDVCQRISAEDIRQPLARRSEAEAKRAIGAAIYESVQAHAATLAGYYGSGIMDDPERLGNANERMAMLMFGRCSSYLLMLSLRPVKE